MRGDRTKQYKSIYLKSTANLEKLFSLRGELSKAGFYEELARDGLLFRLMKIMDKPKEVELLQLMTLDQLIDVYLLHIKYLNNKVDRLLSKIEDVET